MKQYLIRFVYDFYCQGYEDATETVLVRAGTYQEACRKISVAYRNARDFFNLTLE